MPLSRGKITATKVFFTELETADGTISKRDKRPCTGPLLVMIMSGSVFGR